MFKPKPTFTVYRETAKEFKELSKPMKVYRWASRFVNENMPYSLGDGFYWTEAAKRLLFKLRNVERGLIGLVGLQGTGKTATLYELQAKLEAEMPKRVFLYSWRDSVAKRFKEHENVWDTFGKSEAFSRERKIVFIDMSDYDKQSRSRMNKHLNEIRDFWLRTRQYNVSVVVSIQAEMFKGHFLYGKIDAVTLEPLKPEQLVEAYVKLWQNTEPFKPEALQLIAELSRGIFRRFMRYIQLCIERQQIIGAEGLIDAQFVNETITFDQLVKDMDLELSDIFKQQQSKLEAVKILNRLRQCKEPPNQKQLAETLSLSEASVGRYIEKLEAYRYVRRKRDAHGQWMVELNA
jgi:hypothetical protein